MPIANNDPSATDSGTSRLDELKRQWIGSNSLGAAQAYINALEYEQKQYEHKYTADYTPDRWIYYHQDTLWPRENPATVALVGNYTVARDGPSYEFHGSNEGDARRIAACVNACAGVPTEDVEALANDPSAVARSGLILQFNKETWCEQVKEAIARAVEEWQHDEYWPAAIAERIRHLMLATGTDSTLAKNV